MFGNEVRRYSHFVNTFLCELSEGSKLDSGDSSTVSELLNVIKSARGSSCDDTNDCLSAAEKVLRSRFVIGSDDTLYLSSGLAVLWSAVGSDCKELEFELAPSGLYAPSAIGGLRKGFIAALQSEHRMSQKSNHDETLNDIMKILRAMLQGIVDLDGIDDAEALRIVASLVEEAKSNDNDSLATVLLCKQLESVRALKAQAEGHARKITELEGAIVVLEGNIQRALVSATVPELWKEMQRLVLHQHELIIELQKNRVTHTVADATLATNEKEVMGKIYDIETAFGGLRAQITSLQESEERQRVLEGNAAAEALNEAFAALTTLRREAQKMQWAATTSGSAEDNEYVALAIWRGLVGQRGPTEASGTHAGDKKLKYVLPDSGAVAKFLNPMRWLMESSPEPAAKKVEDALQALNHPAKRRRTDGVADTSTPFALDPPSAATTSAALAQFRDNFAVVPVQLNADGCGIEVPHRVRWMPQGRRAATMARVAVWEHTAARCAELAAAVGTSAKVKAALERAASVIKLKQLSPLYALREAEAHNDEPHPLGTDVPMATRPCAHLFGSVQFPTNFGVVPIRDGMRQSSCDDEKAFEVALRETMAPTASVRNAARREGVCNVYVAPAPDALPIREAASIGTLCSSTGTAPTVSESDLSLEHIERLMNRAILEQHYKTADRENAASIDAFLKVADSDNAISRGAETRRDGLWTEFHRHSAISQDRLWTFIKHLGGSVGGNVSEIVTMANEATLEASMALQKQRLEITKRVSDTQSKIVEIVVSSMLKNSNFAMQYESDDSALAVIDTDARQKLSDLAAGVSGRPFFEANVAMRSLTDATQNPPKLKDVMASLSAIGTQMQRNLEASLLESSSASASLAELSHPANSYCVNLRADALVAVRSAHERVNCELGMLGFTRRLALWECVEGGCAVLTSRFAEVAGFLLVQSRSSTGVGAFYISHHAIRTNSIQARVALARLVAVAKLYVRRVAEPLFLDKDTKRARQTAMRAGSQVREIHVARSS